jgi:hypothetical protein
MAADARNAKHATLTAATLKTIKLSAVTERVTVVNRDGADAVYFRADSVTPTVEGDDCYVLPAAIGSMNIPCEASTEGYTEVRIISAGTPKISVEVIQ